MTEKRKHGDNKDRKLTVREQYEYAIEWQLATGNILMACRSTRELGKAKIKDAERRSDTLYMLIERGKI